MTQLKVCGLHRDDDVSFAADPSVSHVGFIFVPNSRRYILPVDARGVMNRLNDGTQAIGVFVDAPLEDIAETVQIANLNGIQLHGQETPDMCRLLRTTGVTVWKSLSVAVDVNEPESLVERIEPFVGAVDAVLLDTVAPRSASPGVTGGHGLMFEWGILPALSARLEALNLEVPIWIAGGITPDNAEQLLSTWRPAGIDVSSGVEVQGRKSPERIKQLISVVKTHG